MTTLSALRNSMQKGPARSNQFIVAVDLPRILLGQVGRDGTVLPSNVREVLSIQAEVAQIPAMEIGEILVPYAGQRIPFAGDRVYNDLVMTFRVDTQYRSYEALLAWQDMLVSLDTGCRILDNDDTSSDITVSAIYHNGCPTERPFTWKFNGCKPKSIGGLTFDHKSENEIVTCEVTFSVLNYDYSGFDAQIPLL